VVKPSAEDGKVSGKYVRRMNVGFKSLIMGAGGIPVKEGLQQGNVGAAVTLTFLRGGSLVDNVAPRGTNDLHADGRDDTKDGIGDG
jgi:hypothetical protein